LSATMTKTANTRKPASSEVIGSWRQTYPA
jgi:hypothetical protein